MPVEMIEVRDPKESAVLEGLEPESESSDESQDMESGLSSADEEDTEPEVPPAPVIKRIVKMPNHVMDPLARRGYKFTMPDPKTGQVWAYDVYEVKARHRMLVKRLGVVEYEVPDA